MRARTRHILHWYTAALAFAIPMGASDAAAQECLDYGDAIRLVGTAPVTDAANDIVTIGNYAYVANGEDGVLVLDISVPDAPVPVGSLDMSSSAEAIATDGTYLYIANRVIGLVVVDITNPTEPTPAASLFLDGTHARGIDVQDGIACVANGNYGFYFIDIGIPTSPIELGDVDPSGAAFDVSIQGTWAYGLSQGHLRVIDIANPDDPWVVAHLHLPGGTYRIEVHGDRAYVAGDRLNIIDVSAPEQPELLTTTPPAYETSGVLVDDSLAYAMSSSGSVLSVDVTNLECLRTLGAARVFGSGVYPRAALAQGHLYYTNGTQSVAVFDVSNPTPITANLDLPPYSNRGLAGYMSEQGVRTYVTQWDPDSLSWLNIGAMDPLCPEPVAPSIGGGFGVDVNNGRFYLCGESAFVVSTLDANGVPSAAGSAPIHGSRVTASGDFAYVTTNDQLHVVDVLDPSAPQPVGTVTVASAFDVDVSGNYAYVTGNGGIDIVDVGTPDQPVVTGSLSTNGLGRGVAVPEELAFVDLAFIATINPGTLQIIDVSDPTTPLLVSETPLVRDAVDVETDGTHVYITAGELLIYDISDPFAPQLVGRTGSVSGLLDIADDVLFGLGETGVASMPLQCTATTGAVEAAAVPAATSLRLTIGPNPFRSAQTIQYELSERVGVELFAYDVNGRPVRILDRGERPAGTHTTHWDGRDERGRRLPAGVYFYDLRAGEKKASGTITLVR